MKRKRFTTEQIIKILKEAELGIKITELCRKHGIFEQTFYNWRNKSGGMEISEAKRLKLIDDFTRESPRILVVRSIPAGRVTAFIDQIALYRGYPKRIRVDNGPEFNQCSVSWLVGRTKHYSVCLL